MITVVNPYRFVAGGAFNPETDVTSAGIVFWLEAGDDCENSSGVPATDGQTIQYWRDKSTNGNDWSQATAGNRPTFDADAGASWNNGPAVAFSNASSQYLTGPNLSALTASEFFFLLVIPSTANVGWCNFNTYSTNNHYTLGGIIYDGIGSSARKTVGTPATTLTNPHIYNVINTSSEWTANIDGSQEFTTATNTVSFGSGPPRLGASYDTTLWDWTGSMVAVLLYDGKLSTDDRTAVYNYLDALRA